MGRLYRRTWDEQIVMRRIHLSTSDSWKRLSEIYPLLHNTSSPSDLVDCDASLGAGAGEEPITLDREHLD